MSDDDLDQPERDDAPAPVTVDRKVLLLALGGVAALAVILAVMRARTAPRTVPLGVDLTGPDADWRSSLEHLAAAFDVRLSGIDARLDQLAGEHVAATAAAFSAPAPTLNGDVPERVPPPVNVGANEPAPPAPASVSMPPESD